MYLTGLQQILHAECQKKIFSPSTQLSSRSPFLEEIGLKPKNATLLNHGRPQQGKPEGQLRKECMNSWTSYGEPARDKVHAQMIRSQATLFLLLSKPSKGYSIATVVFASNSSVVYAQSNFALMKSRNTCQDFRVAGIVQAYLSHICLIMASCYIKINILSHKRSGPYRQEEIKTLHHCVYQENLRNN